MSIESGFVKIAYVSVNREITPVIRNKLIRNFMSIFVLPCIDKAADKLITK